MWDGSCARAVSSPTDPCRSVRSTAASPTATSWPRRSTATTSSASPANALRCSASTGPTRPKRRDAAADLGIGPAVLGMLEQVGTLVTELVQGHHLEPTPFVERLDDVVALIRRFHESGPLGGAFPIHRIVEWHARDAAGYGVGPRPRTSACINSAGASRRPSPVADADGAVPQRPAARQRAVRRRPVWLLDFEYAGMNDVFFDLGNLSVNSELNHDAEERLLHLYFGQRHQGVVGAAAADEDDERVPRGDVGRRATSDQHPRHRLRVVRHERLGNCERLAGGPSSSDGLPTLPTRSAEHRHVIPSDWPTAQCLSPGRWRCARFARRADRPSAETSRRHRGTACQPLQQLSPRRPR